MKKIAQEILEFFLYEAMDTATAFATLGLDRGDYAGVDKAFKKMAMQHHPDRGGDPEMMKKINVAKEVLAAGASSMGADSGYKRETEAERYEKNKVRVAKAKVVTDTIFNDLDPKVQLFVPKLKAHLEEFTGKVFTEKTKVKKADNSIEALDKNWSMRDMHTFDGYVAWLLVFESNDGGGLSKYVIELEAKVDWRDLENVLSVESLDFDMSFETFAYSENKKTKMQAKRWGNRAKSTSLGKPEDFFPSKKLIKSVTTAKTRLTKRADAFAFLKTEMKAIAPYTDPDTLLIPIGDNKFVRMHRLVFYKLASWSFDDVMIENTEVRFNKYSSFVLKGGNPMTLFKLMTGSDSISRNNKEEGTTTLMEAMPDFGKIVKDVVDLIKKEKYREAGKLLAEKGKEYEEVIEPAIKNKTLK